MIKVHGLMGPKVVPIPFSETQNCRPRNGPIRLVAKLCTSPWSRPSDLGIDPEMLVLQEHMKGM